MKLTKTFLLFVTVFFISTNIFSQQEDVLERIKRIPHNPNVNFPDETLTKDIFLNGKLKQNAIKNVLATYEVVDSAIATSEDSTVEKYKYEFDSNGNMTSRLYQWWDGTSWVNGFRGTFTYDLNGNMAFWVYAYWDGTSWVNYWRGTYNYNGNMISGLWEEWDGTSWVNSERHTLTYDSNGNMTSWLHENWDGTSWVNSSRYTYTYNSNGNMTSELYENWDGTSWENIERETYTYNSNGNMIYYLREYWNGTNWYYYERRTYTYNSSGNMTLELSETWDGTNWENYHRETYTYDSNGNMTWSLNEYWDGTNWVLSDNVLGFTDSFNNSYLISGAEIELYYKTITSAEESGTEIMDYSLSQNYPNPFNPSTQISFSIPKDSHVKLELFNTLGEKVATLIDKEMQAGSHNYQLSISNYQLPSGIYFYKLQSGSFSETKKMILLK